MRSKCVCVQLHHAVSALHKYYPCLHFGGGRDGGGIEWDGRGVNISPVREAEGEEFRGIVGSVARFGLFDAKKQIWPFLKIGWTRSFGESIK